MRILRFLRLTDGQDRLSLTNLAVFIALGRIAIMPELNPVDVPVLALVLFNYVARKWIDLKTPEAPTLVMSRTIQLVSKDVKDLNDNFDEIKKDVASLRGVLALKNSFAK